MLAELGFTEDEFAIPVSGLSGGQQNRLMFARAMITEPNLVLFDEPTSHLDVKTIIQFKPHLEGLRAAFILISHDRDFLDAVTNRTLILRDCQLYSFALPFSAARARLAEQDEAAEAARRAEDKAIDSLATSAKRLATWGKVYDNEDLARKAKSMEKRAERMKEERTFVSRGSPLKLNLDPASSRARRMLTLECLTVPNPGTGTPLFNVGDFFLRPGDRVALLGENGTDKSTLIRMIMQASEAQQAGGQPERFA